MRRDRAETLDYAALRGPAPTVMSNEALLRVVTWLAGRYAVVVRAPDELAARVEELVVRLRR